MSTISASTTSTTAYVVTADTTGTLVLKTGASPTTAMTISSSQIVSFANPPTATGGGSVSTNTAFGTSALAANTTGAYNTSVGYQSGYTNTTGVAVTAFGYQAAYSGSTNNYTHAFGFQAAYTTTGDHNAAFGNQALYLTTSGAYNTAIGNLALRSNTTASYNTAVGYQAGYSNQTGTGNVYIGQSAGYLATSSTNTFVGAGAGQAMTSGARNTFVGNSAGYNTTGGNNTFIGVSATSAAGAEVTTGTKNTILGGFSGNQDGLDMRTFSNQIVLSDGDGNARFGSRGNGWLWLGSYRASDYNRSSYPTGATISQGTTLFGISAYPATTEDSLLVYACTAGSSPNAAAATLKVWGNTSTGRSIAAGGTIAQSGADYAEYMTKAGDFTVAKGDVVGIDADGKLTNVFSNAVAFAVKSTNPGLVGGDSWHVEQPRDENHEFITSGPEYDAWEIAQEAARQTVDRIAFCGQVPVNVTGATAGQYIIPVDDNGAIKGEAVSNPTFEQYQQAVGKVIAIEQDGRARIIVKVV